MIILALRLDEEQEGEDVLLKAQEGEDALLKARQLRKIILACSLPRSVNELVNELSGISLFTNLELISTLTSGRKKTTRYFLSRCPQNPSQRTRNIG